MRTSRGIWVRGFDIVISSSALVFFAPLVLIIAIALKLISRAPVFQFYQAEGRGGKAYARFSFNASIGVCSKRREAASTIIAGDAAPPHLPRMLIGSAEVRFKLFLWKSGLSDLPGLANILIGQESFFACRAARH